MRRLAVAGGVMGCLVAAAAGAATPMWQIDVTEFDKAGTLAGAPQTVACPESGCQQLVTLEVAGKPQRFLLSVTLAARGAYVGLQAQDPAVGKVVEFEKGFVGPVFMVTHAGLRTSAVLRFTLTGAGVSDPEQDRLMASNSASLVFHRKMEPDLSLRVELVPPELAAPAGPAPRD